MPPKDPNDNSDSQGIGFRLKVAAVLLGTYAAMHLAVGGFVRAWTSPDATAAAATRDSPTPSTPTSTSSTPTEASLCPVESPETFADKLMRHASEVADSATD
jgi:hypothetical protein